MEGVDPGPLLFFPECIPEILSPWVQLLDFWIILSNYINPHKMDTSDLRRFLQISHVLKVMPIM